MLTKSLAASDVESRIVDVRAERVILDRDLAETYGVETRVLNQAVKRNRDRSPSDFAFQLTIEEAEVIRRSRSQTVTLKRGSNVKYRPWAFTEHGAIMAATILNSPRAVEMRIFVVRAFIRLREIARGHAEIGKRLDELERRVTKQDETMKEVFSALRALLVPPARPKPGIGFKSKGKEQVQSQ